MTAEFEFHDPLQAAYFEPVAMVNVKIAHMKRMVQTGKLKLWRHIKKKIVFMVKPPNFRRRMPIRRLVWIRPFIKVIYDMRFVREPEDKNLPPAIVQELEQEIVKQKKLIKNCIPELEHLIPKHEKIICELRLLSTQLRRGYSLTAVQSAASGMLASRV